MRFQWAGIFAVWCLVYTGNIAKAQPTATPPPFDYTIKEAKEIEKKTRLDPTELYDTFLPKLGKLGERIRSEPFDGYVLPTELKPKDLGIKAVRFLYRSKSTIPGNANDDVP